MALSVRTFNNALPAICYPIKDIQSVEFTTGAIGGFLTATIQLNRPPMGSYVELAFGYHLEIVAEDGDVVWEGMINSLPQQVGATRSFTVGAVGYMAFLTYQSATWQPNYTIATDIRTIITDGLTAAVPPINFSTVTAPVTGRLVTYTGQTNTGSVRSQLDELIKYGNSANSSLYWQVWRGRTFYLTPRPTPITSFDYATSLALCEDSSLGLNGDDFYTRVTVRYRDAVSTQMVTVNNTAMQTRYRQVFGTNNPAGTTYNFVREPDIQDITSHGIMTLSQATFVANTMLARYAGDGIRVTASRLLVSDGQAVRDANTGMIVKLPKVRAGKSLYIADVFGAGLTYPTNSYMFVSQTRYTEAGDGTTKLEVDAESIVTLENLLAGILSVIPQGLS